MTDFGRNGNFGHLHGGIAVDSTSVYWGGSWGFGTGWIRKLVKSSSTVSVLAENVGSGGTPNQPRDVNADGSSVYWIDVNGGPFNTTGVRQVPISGGNFTTLTTIGHYTAMAIDLTNVFISYFDNPFTPITCKLAKISKSGGNLVDLASIEGENVCTSGIVVDENNVYWVEAASGKVKKVPISGGTVTTLASGLNDPARIAVDQNYVYWTEAANGVAGAGAVKYVSKNGGQVVTLASGLNKPYGTATDGVYLFWTEQNADGTNGTIKTLALPP